MNLPVSLIWLIKWRVADSSCEGVVLESFALDILSDASSCICLIPSTESTFHASIYLILDQSRSVTSCFSCRCWNLIASQLYNVISEVPIITAMSMFRLAESPLRFCLILINDWVRRILIKQKLTCGWNVKTADRLRHGT